MLTSDLLMELLELCQLNLPRELADLNAFSPTSLMSTLTDFESFNQNMLMDANAIHSWVPTLDVLLFWTNLHRQDGPKVNDKIEGRTQQTSNKCTGFVHLESNGRIISHMINHPHLKLEKADQFFPQCHGLSHTRCTRQDWRGPSQTMFKDRLCSRLCLLS